MPSVDAGGTELHYVRAGSGEPMLLIQGMSATHMTWGRPFLAPLEQSFDCVVFDNRGMGLSGPAQLPFEIADLAGDALALLDALEIERAHVVGISMGGMIAQELLLAHPERIRTLSLGATYCGGPEGTLMARADLEMLGAAMASGDRTQVFRAMWEINLSPAFREDEERFAEFCEMGSALPAPREVILQQMKACAAHDTSARLAPSGSQVVSLASRRTLHEDGVVFHSHLDGSIHTLTPESAADIQARLGPDVAMMFDECPSWPATHEQSEAAMTRTLRWARRGRDRFLALGNGRVSGIERPTPGQVQFGIVQGGVYEDLRDRSVAETVAVGFDAYAIGGLSVGEPVEVMYDVVAHTATQLPDTLPRYLMGTGTPADLVESVGRGVDLFDCVLPTRNARNGQLFTRHGTIAIKNSQYASDFRPPDPECGCPTCQRHSRAYLRHLFLAGEMNAAVLNTLHNLHFYLDTMQRIRKAIEFGTFETFKADFLQTLAGPPPALLPYK